MREQFVTYLVAIIVHASTYFTLYYETTG